VSLDATDTDTTTEAVEGFMVTGGSGADVITANGDANFTVDLTAGGGNTVNLAGGDDIVKIDEAAGDTADYVDLGAGDDEIENANEIQAKDTLLGGEGIDVLAFGNNDFTAGAAHANVSGFDVIDFGDNAKKATLNDDIVAQSDNDILTIQGGDNVATTVDASAVTTGTVLLKALQDAATATGTFVLAAGGNTVSLDATDTDTTTEAVEGFMVTGGSGADVITANGDANFTVKLDTNNGNNMVTLLGGNDTIILGTGDDNVDAGAGNDTITGGDNVDGNDDIDGGEGDDQITFNVVADITPVIANVEDVQATFTTNKTLTASSITGADVVISLKGQGANAGTTGEAVGLVGITSDHTVRLNQNDFDDALTLGLATDDGDADSLSLTLEDNMATGSSLTVANTVEIFNLQVGVDATAKGANVIDGSNVAAETVNITSGTGNTDNLSLGTLGADVTTVNAESFAGDLAVTTGTGAQVITGGSGADTLDGGAGADTISGGAGDDQITMRDAADVLDGGEGSDTLVVVGNVADGTAALGVDLSAATGQITNFKGIAGPQDVQGFENVDLSGYTGTGANITGSDEDNTIAGTAKNDVIDGGDGADTFVFAGSAVTNGTDTILNFVVTDNDVLDFSSFFTNATNTTEVGDGGDEDLIAATKTVVTIDNSAVAIAGKDYAGADFAELFSTGGNGGNGGFLNSANGTAGANSENIIIIQGSDETQIFYVENDATAAIVASEVTLVGVLDSNTTELTAANVNEITTWS
jgi:Ca2+-binding RTX toxin-like protein